MCSNCVVYCRHFLKDMCFRLIMVNHSCLNFFNATSLSLCTSVAIKANSIFVLKKKQVNVYFDGQKIPVLTTIAYKC